MVLEADGGGVSAAEPAALRTAGAQFRVLTNAVTGISDTANLQSGGQFEQQMLTADDANLGASTTSFQTDMGHLSRALLEALIAAAPQLADAAVDLFDVAGAFVSADTAIPANATPYGNNTWIVPDSTGKSAPSMDDASHATVYYRDSEGHVVVKGDVPINSLPAPPQPRSVPTSTPGPAPTTPSAPPTPGG